MYYDRPALPDARNTRHLIIEAKKGASHLCSIHAEALLVRSASLIEASNEQRDKVVWAHKVLRELLDTLEGEERRSVVEAMDYVHKCLVENQTLFTEDFSNLPVRSRSRSLSDKPSPKSHRSDSRSNPETDGEKIRAPTPVSHLFPPPQPKNIRSVQAGHPPSNPGIAQRQATDKPDADDKAVREAETQSEVTESESTVRQSEIEHKSVSEVGSEERTGVTNDARSSNANPPEIPTAGKTAENTSGAIKKRTKGKSAKAMSAPGTTVNAQNTSGKLPEVADANVRRDKEVTRVHAPENGPENAPVNSLPKEMLQNLQNVTLGEKCAHFLQMIVDNVDKLQAVSESGAELDAGDVETLSLVLGNEKQTEKYVKSVASEWNLQKKKKKDSYAAKASNKTKPPTTHPLPPPNSLALPPQNKQTKPPAQPVIQNYRQSQAYHTPPPSLEYVTPHPQPIAPPYRHGEWDSTERQAGAQTFDHPVDENVEPKRRIESNLQPNASSWYPPDRTKDEKGEYAPQAHLENAQRRNRPGTTNSTVSVSSTPDKILAVSMERECREILASQRPPANKRFSGDGTKIDFDNHLKAFERTMMVTGITPSLKVGELSHWFCGEAQELMDVCLFIKDPQAQYDAMITELTNYFGRKNISAETILDKILDGKQIADGDSKSLRTFLIALRKFHVFAIQTGSDQHFDSPDVLNKILRTKLAFMTRSWSKKRTELNRREGYTSDLKFVDLIKFIEYQAELFETIRVVSGEKPKKVKETTINALSTDPQTDGTEAKGRRKKGKGKKPTTDVDKTTDQANTQEKKTPKQPEQKVSKPESGEKQGQTNKGAVGRLTFKCRNCGGTSFHEINDCSAFLLADVAGKLAMLGKGGRCFRCFERGHLSADCDKDNIRCDKCGKAHQTCLHDDERE